MKTWKQALKDALVSGSLASLVSTAALATRGKQETGSPFAPTNAISHWLWGDRAARHNEPDLRHTLLGYTIHHASSLLWATIYERFFTPAGQQASAQVKRNTSATLLGSATVAATACFVDYKLTPHRLQPGYEMRLSKKSLFLVYASFAAGLAASHIIAGYRRR